jgi:putative membrane protein
MKKLLLLAIAMAPPQAAVLAADKNPDAAFYKKAAEGGMAEVELGKLAQQKSASQSVKEFGAMMIDDHSAANEELKSIAATKDINWPSSPSVAQKATKTKLEMLSGATFDKSYIKGMIKDHEEDIKEFQKEVDAGRDPEAKAFARSILPTLRAHLSKIQSIAQSAGLTANADTD